METGCKIEGAGVTQARRWGALGATTTLLLAASLAFGEDPTPCYEAYRTSYLNGQQLNFEEFRDLYRDDICAAENPSTEAAGAGLQDLRGGTQE